MSESDARSVCPSVSSPAGQCQKPWQVTTALCRTISAVVAPPPSVPPPPPPLPVPCPRRSGSLSSPRMPLIWLDSHVLWPLGQVKRVWAPLEVPSDRVGSVRFMFHPLQFLYLLMSRVRVFQMEGVSCASRHLSCYSLCVYLCNCLLVTSCMRANGQPSPSPASPPSPSPPPWLPIFLFPTSDLPCFVRCLKRGRERDSHKVWTTPTEKVRYL